MLSHAANTVVDHLGGDEFRAYFSCRDKDNRSHIAYVDFDLTTQKVLRIADKPILAPGRVGTFDDSGVSLSCLRNIGGRKFLYYLGWNLGVTVPWRNSIGLAIFNEQTNAFERVSEAPILDRSHVDPFSISYPFVLQEGGLFRMWYGSNLDWGPDQKQMAHIIKYAESPDGIHWTPTGRICLNFESPDEYAMSRPYVIKENGKYRMWYSFRGQSYRIGYAESKDGLEWTRKDAQVGITVSPSGWDSEMVEYPFLFEHQGHRYMTYNGNAYGKTGFGLARLVED